MSDAEPKDRLRAARTKLGLSRERLARKLGKSNSTIRAHENGQNQILPDAAAAYAKELGVSAAWLLYGTPHDEALAAAGPKTRSIPLVGEIWDKGHFIPEDEPFDPGNELFFTISLPEYQGLELTAYILRGDEFDYYHRRYVVVSPIEAFADLTLVDEVLVRIREGRLFQLGIWRVGAGNEAGKTLFYQGPSQKEMRRMVLLSNGEEGARGDRFEIIGRIAARVEVRRRSPKLIAPSPPED